MKRNSNWLISIVVNLSFSVLVLAQTQNSSSSPSETRQNEITHRVQIQLLVASNIATAKTNYPSSLEAVVKQLKSSLPFKTHYLVATYLFNVADKGSFDVGDVSNAQFEPGSGLSPTYLTFGIAGIRLNGESVHLTRLKFESRRTTVTRNSPGDTNTAKPIFESVVTGITTELNVSEGVPTIVGTTSSALSDGVLVVVVTVNHSGKG